ncbi:MAG: winged helix DNA-binding domain-containing protein [Solirubrobacterales bacterium]|nr:winged helix DNA-binding domain-containing protein [Solirubrobacterales bacterium]
MRRTLDDDGLRALRVRAQGLCGPGPVDVASAVRAVGAVPAQDTRASRLAVRPRSSGLSAEDVRRACDTERSVVRTWAMRGTLHMLATEDLGWVLAALGPTFAAAGRPRRMALGLDDETCERGLRALREVLVGSEPLVRSEVVRRLAGFEVALDPAGQAPAHLIALAALHGVLCRGPETEREEATYVLLDDWVGPIQAVDPDRALAELIRRYLASHGPATAHDLAAWSGIGMRRARAGLGLVAGELAEVETHGGRAWCLTASAGTRRDATVEGSEVPEGPCVRLLGRFDPYLLGHRGRELVLEPAFAGRIQAGGGIVQPAVLVDGRVMGTWRRERAGDRPAVTIDLFSQLPDDLRPGLEAEAADVGRFLGMPSAPPTNIRS